MFDYLVMEKRLSLEEIRKRSHKSLTKLMMLTVVCGVVFTIVDLTFENFVKPYTPMLMEYKTYVNAIAVLGLGYVMVNSAATFFYWISRSRVDHPTAELFRTVTRIVGVALLLAVLTSIFNVNPSAALTVSSFTGMVVGFATQRILGQAVAGIFLALTRPFKPGDLVTVAGQTGVVRTIGVMHTILVTEDGSTEIMIPSTNIVTTIIKKKID